MKKLNLGCGKVILDDFVNLDKLQLPGVTIAHNLNKFPYPFKDDEFDYILAKDILEHLDNPMRVLEELHRISKNNALIEITAPHFSSGNFHVDLTHKHAFSVNSFRYFTKDYWQNYYTKARFEIIEQKIIFERGKLLNLFWNVIEKLANIRQGFYECNFAYIFQANNVHVILKAIKN